MINPFKREKKENPIGSAYLVNGVTEYSFKNNKKAYIDEGYKQNAVVYHVISKIVKSICDVGIYVVDKNGEKVDNHPAIDLLNNPNPTDGKNSLLKKAFIDFLITGEMAITKDKDGVPNELWTASPVDINVIPGRGGIAKEYIYKVNNFEKSFPVNPIDGASQLFFHKMYDPNPRNYWRGQSPLQAASLAADTNNAGLKWNWSLLYNGARPSGILKTDGEPSGQVKNRLKEFIAARTQGPDNAGRPLVLDKNTEWQEIGHNPKDMDYTKTMLETTKFIAGVYDVPLPLVGVESTTFNNMGTAKEMLWTDTVLPLLDEFLQAFGGWLLPAYGEDLKFKADLESIPALEGIRNSRADRMIKYKTAGIVTVDEVRVDIGLEPIGGMAGILTVNANQIPIEMIDDTGAGTTNADKSFIKDLMALGYTKDEIKHIMVKDDKR